MGSWHTIQSDAVGNFRWPGFAPGDYTFYARGGGLASAESAPITVRAGEVSEVELVLRAGAFLILSVDGVEPGQMAEGMVRVDVRDAQNRQVGALLGADAFGSRLNSTNHFDERSFGPLAPGSYRAIVTGPDGHRAERLVDLVTGQKLHLRMAWED
ncbi:MAG: hypothetical protein GC161_10075 [Planctomycetaceae bacterium]|nr:hypothetical protein [Planctomycetaceae bacterium]